MKEKETNDGVNGEIEEKLKSEEKSANKQTKSMCLKDVLEYQNFAKIENEETKSMDLDKILKYQNFVKSKENDENIKILSPEESVDRQFFNFLKRIRMEKYFDKFKQSECCDLESIGLFDDDTLKEDIGIKNKIHRRRILANCKEMKVEIEKFKNNHGIPLILYERLAKYGIITLSILCNEVKEPTDLKMKFEIANENQCDLLWDVVQQNENMMQLEGV